MVNSHEGKKPSPSIPLVAHAARGSTTSKTLTLDRCQQYGDLRLLEVTEERNGPSGLRDDDDDDDDDVWLTLKTFWPGLRSKHASRLAGWPVVPVALRTPLKKVISVIRSVFVVILRQ